MTRPLWLPNATMHSWARSRPADSAVIRAAAFSLRRATRAASFCSQRCSALGKKMATSMTALISPNNVRLVLKRPYNVMPSTMPCCCSDRPAPSQIASGPAIPKKATVATKVMNTDVRASGSRTPARRITQMDIGEDPDWNGVR